MDERWMNEICACGPSFATCCLVCYLTAEVRITKRVRKEQLRCKMHSGLKCMLTDCAKLSPDTQVHCVLLHCKMWFPIFVIQVYCATSI